MLALSRKCVPCSSISGPKTCWPGLSRKQALPEFVPSGLEVALVYASDNDALGAAFRGGPVALAYSRYDEVTKQAVHTEYLRSISAYWIGGEYRVPGEFVVAAGVKPPPT